MKITKTTITILLAGLVSIASINAQSIQEGVNHLYAERNKSAKETFEKMVATNPNNLEAVYWLCRTPKLQGICIPKRSRLMVMLR